MIVEKVQDTKKQHQVTNQLKNHQENQMHHHLNHNQKQPKAHPILKMKQSVIEKFLIPAHFPKDQEKRNHYLQYIKQSKKICESL